MRRFRNIVWAVVVLMVSLLAGCTDYAEHFRQNVVLGSSKWNGAKLKNGDVIALDYYCEKATYATVSIVVNDDSSDTSEVLQYEKYLMKKGEDVINITLNVGDYVGKATVGVSYLGIYENGCLFMDELEIEKSRIFDIEIVSKDSTI